MIMCGQRIEFGVDKDGVRLDKYLANQLTQLSRSAARRLIDSGGVTVNSEPVKASYRIRLGDMIVVCLSNEESAEPVAEEIPLKVVYEDRALLVVDKPAGMVVHPAPGHSSGTLVNALLAYYPELVDVGDKRPGIVHRLDRDTSGLILVAKNEKARRALQRQFKDRLVHKVYLALLDGQLQPAWGRIEAPVGRDPQHRQRMAILAGGREAITEYHVLEYFQRVGSTADDYTLVEVEPHTGRTHQIRVHMASIEHAVVGDIVYGRRRSRLPVARQFLHAWKLGFKHPTAGQRMDLESPLPADLSEILDSLRQR
jgi:23S rRNA pseudouridine1911/1915/1917 synthase